MLINGDYSVDDSEELSLDVSSAESTFVRLFLFSWVGGKREGEVREKGWRCKGVYNVYVG